MGELGLHGVPIIGNSLGGMTALWLALDAPRLVSRVGILGVPATALPGARPDLILSLLSIPWLNRLVLGVPARAWTSRAAMRHALGAGFGSKVPPEMFTIHALARRRPEFVVTIASWMPQTHVWRGGRSSVAIPDVELAELGQRTLFLWGESDVFGGPLIARRAASLMPDARVETLPTGHHPQLTAVEQCARSLMTFLG
jgi:pimeloyl-ACP methyl ester carboxylesterase